MQNPEQRPRYVCWSRGWDRHSSGRGYGEDDGSFVTIVLLEAGLPGTVTAHEVPYMTAW